MGVSGGASLNISGGIDNAEGKIVTLAQDGSGTLTVGDVTNSGAGVLNVADGSVGRPARSAAPAAPASRPARA